MHTLGGLDLKKKYSQYYMANTRKLSIKPPWGVYRRGASKMGEA